jgi:hypothetical protein
VSLCRKPLVVREMVAATTPSIEFRDELQTTSSPQPLQGGLKNSTSSASFAQNVLSFKICFGRTNPRELPGEESVCAILSRRL